MAWLAGGWLAAATPARAGFPAPGGRGRLACLARRARPAECWWGHPCGRRPAVLAGSRRAPGSRRPGRCQADPADGLGTAARQAPRRGVTVPPGRGAAGARLAGRAPAGRAPAGRAPAGRAPAGRAPAGPVLARRARCGARSTSRMTAGRERAAQCRAAQCREVMVRGEASRRVARVLLSAVSAPGSPARLLRFGAAGHPGRPRRSRGQATVAPGCPRPVAGPGERPTRYLAFPAACGKRAGWPVPARAGRKTAAARCPLRSRQAGRRTRQAGRRNCAAGQRQAAAGQPPVPTTGFLVTGPAVTGPAVTGSAAGSLASHRAALVLPPPGPVHLPACAVHHAPWGEGHRAVEAALLAWAAQEARPHPGGHWHPGPDLRTRLAPAAAVARGGGAPPGQVATRRPGSDHSR